MKIGQQQGTSTSASLARSLKWIGALLLAFVVGLIAGGQEWDAVVRDLGAATARIAQSMVPPGDLPTLVVDMNFTAYDDILAQREEALRVGVTIPSDRHFVTATIQMDGTPVPVTIRLLEGPADHLGDDEKWGFEVRTRGDHQLLNMRRFYLTDPAANNWLNEWAFARTLEREDVLVAHYQFVHLILNGTDRGIYALQEGFADELLTSQGRPEGVIVTFDADLLWESIAHFGGDARAAMADPVAHIATTDFQYFEVDTYRTATVARDPELSAQKDTAIGLLRGLQNGTLIASDVFDVETYGRFLALVDLWGATEGTSLVNLRYYYHPIHGRLEPIGFNANALGSDDRLSLSATYDDPALQMAYVEEALRISQPEYLDQLQAELEPEFQRLQGTLGPALSLGRARAEALSAERRELEPPWDQLRDRQEQMRRSLDPVQPVFAHLGSPTLAMSGTLRIDVANVTNLPVEIVGFDVEGATFLPADRRWLRGNSDELLTNHADRLILRGFDRDRTPVIRYAHFDVPLAEIQRLDAELDFMHELDIQVATRILGLSTTHLTPADHGYPDILAPGVTE